MYRRQFISGVAGVSVGVSSLTAGLQRYRPVVIDAHAHFGYLGLFGQRDVAFEEALEAADEAGIDKLCVSSIESTELDMEGGNRALYQLMKRYPERVIGFATLTSPHFGTKGLDEIRHSVESYGMRGIGELITHTYDPLDIPAWIAVLELAAALKIPVLAHAPPVPCVSAARRVPEATILLAHIGTGLGLSVDEWLQAIGLAKTSPNVYVETCTSITSYGQIELAVKELGPERVVFGTDLPLLDPSVQKAKVTGADIAASALPLILGQNMARILGIPDRIAG
jgi:uncharacterized protein